VAGDVDRNQFFLHPRLRLEGFAAHYDVCEPKFRLRFDFLWHAAQGRGWAWPRSDRFFLFRAARNLSYSVALQRGRRKLGPYAHWLLGMEGPNGSDHFSRWYFGKGKVLRVGPGGLFLGLLVSISFPYAILQSRKLWGEFRHSIQGDRFVVGPPLALPSGRPGLLGRFGPPAVATRGRFPLVALALRKSEKPSGESVSTSGGVSSAFCTCSAKNGSIEERKTSTRKSWRSHLGDAKSRNNLRAGWPLRRTDARVSHDSKFSVACSNKQKREGHRHSPRHSRHWRAWLQGLRFRPALGLGKETEVSLRLHLSRLALGGHWPATTVLCSRRLSTMFSLIRCRQEFKNRFVVFAIQKSGQRWAVGRARKLFQTQRRFALFREQNHCF